MALAAERKLDLTLPQRVSREQLQEVLDRAQADQRNAAWVCMALDCSLRGLALLVEHHGLQHHPWVRRMLPTRRRGKAAADVTGTVQVRRRGRQMPEGEKVTVSESGAGAPPTEAGEPQATEQAKAGEAPDMTPADQAEAEEATMQLQALAEAQDNDTADKPAEATADTAPVSQHLCSRCVKADVCPTPEVLAGYWPEMPALPVRLVGAVDLEVRVEVRYCRYYLPAPDGETAAD